MFSSSTSVVAEEMCLAAGTAEESKVSHGFGCALNTLVITSKGKIDYLKHLDL